MSTRKNTSAIRAKRKLRQVQEQLDKIEPETPEEVYALQKIRRDLVAASAEVDGAVMSSDEAAVDRANRAIARSARSARNYMDDRASSLVTVEEKHQIAADLIKFRDLHGLTQAQLAAELNWSPKKYQNVELKKDTTTLRTWLEAKRFLSSKTGEDRQIAALRVSDIPGPEGLRRQTRLYPLVPENLPAVSSVLRENKLQVMFSVSSEIKWSEEPETKHHIGEVERLINEAKESTDEPKVGGSFVDVIERAEKSQLANQAFADAVPKELWGRLYAAFVTGQFFDEKQNATEGSVLYLVLGAAPGEEWSVRFAGTLDPEEVERTKEFNEHKLKVK